MAKSKDDQVNVKAEKPVDEVKYMTFADVMAWNRANADKLPPAKEPVLTAKRKGSLM